MGSATSGKQPPAEIRLALESNLDALAILERMERRYKELDDDALALRGYLRRANKNIVACGWPREAAAQAGAS